jgi:hypothetical protein
MVKCHCGLYMTNYSDLLRKNTSDDDVRSALLARVDSVISNREKQFKLNLVMTDQ